MPHTIRHTAAVKRTSRRFVRDGALAHFRADAENDRDTKAAPPGKPTEWAATVSEHINTETRA